MIAASYWIPNRICTDRWTMVEIRSLDSRHRGYPSRVAADSVAVAIQVILVRANHSNRARVLRSVAASTAAVIIRSTWIQARAFVTRVAIRSLLLLCFELLLKRSLSPTFGSAHSCLSALLPKLCCLRTFAFRLSNLSATVRACASGRPLLRFGCSTALLFERLLPLLRFSGFLLSSDEARVGNAWLLRLFLGAENPDGHHNRKG